MNNDNPQDRARFAKALWTVAQSVGAEVNEARITIYCDLLLAEYSIEQLERACAGFLRDKGRRFFPTVPEFHEAIGGSSDANATQAARLFEQAMLGSGSYKSVAFEDPALVNTIEIMGGWVYCCQLRLDEREAGYWWHRFREVYEQQDRERAPAVRKYFPGLAEGSNELSQGSWERGRMPETLVEFWGREGKVKRLALAEVKTPAQLTEGAP